MTTYTVFSGTTGVVYGRNLTEEEAMAELLTYDGYRYEIRRDDGSTCWNLWVSDGSENSTRGARHMVKTVAFSLHEDETAATHDIAETVIKARWRRVPECMEDADYDALVEAEI